MLFLFEEPKAQSEDKVVEQATKGQGVIEQLSTLTTALNQWVLPTSIENLKLVFKNVTEQLTTQEDSALALQKTMGGVAINTEGFRHILQESYLKTLDIGGTFKDSAEIVQGLAGEMGRIVSISTEVTTQSIEFSKATNMTSTETGKMVAEFSKFGGTQEQSIGKMSELGKSARKSGLDAKSFTTEVAKNLKQASLFGFKGGVKDIEEMVKKTKLLGTSMEKLQIKGAAEKLLDPETAMQTAASLQMIGGNIGSLGNPFQLLHMGQKDMKKLTDEVLNMAKATFTFDKETGAFTQTTEDMYALRAQAEALGVNYEETANAGKELAKLDFIKSSTKLSEKITDKDTQNLVAGLAQISKEGTVSIELPGLNKSFDSLDDALADPKFMSSLEEYQKNADLSDKALTLKQMSIAEKQAADTNVIKNAVLANLSETKKESVLMQSIAENSEMMGTAGKDLATGIAGESADAITKINTESTEAAITFLNLLKNVKPGQFVKDVVGGVGKEKVEPDGSGDGQTPVLNEQNPVNNDKKTEELGNKDKKTEELKDGYFPPGDEPTIMSKGQIYKGIQEDSVYVGTDFEKIFERGKAATNVLSEMMSKGGGGTTNNQVSGKVDFGEIRVKIDAPGVDTSALDNALNSKQFANQIMAMIANQKSFYTNQATLEG